MVLFEPGLIEMGFQQYLRHCEDLQWEAARVTRQLVEKCGYERMKAVHSESSCDNVIDCDSIVRCRVVDKVQSPKQEYDQAAVEYGALRVALGKDTPPYKVSTNDELINSCKAMAAMASYEITATDRTVELNQSPENVLIAVASATKAHLGKKH